MNLERLSGIVDIYIDQFDVLNNQEHYENMKWAADRVLQITQPKCEEVPVMEPTM